jgi:hypothetical protein
MEMATVSNVVLRNLGPDYRRSSGRVVRRGETFEATHTEVASMSKRKQLGIRFMILAEGKVESVGTVLVDGQPMSQSETVETQGAAVSQPATQDGQEGAAKTEGWPSVQEPQVGEGLVKLKAPKKRKPKLGEDEPRPKRSRAK